MKKTSLIIILALCSILLFAQNEDWLWAKQSEGTNSNSGNSIAADANGNIYVTGCLGSSTTFGTTTLYWIGELDIFVAKLDSKGNWLWAKQAGGTSYDVGNSIAVDTNGNSYVTGYFQYSATFGTNNLIGSGENDIFVAKLDCNGNWLWAKQAGGKYCASGLSIAVDANGNSYITGYFRSSSITFGTTTLTSSGNSDIFVAKLDSNGNWLWAKQAGGTYNDEGNSISVDSKGNSYVTGLFQGSTTFGTTILTSSGNSDIFVAKLDSNGNWLWVKKAGGTDYYDCSGNSIAVDAKGNSYVTGYFEDSATFGTTKLTSSGEDDIFVAKLDSNGNWLWVKKAGGTSSYGGYGIAVDDIGNSYVTGYFERIANFSTTTLTSSGGRDIFVAKLDSKGNWLWAKQAGGTIADKGCSIAVDANGNSYITGYFSESATFGATTLTSSGDSDIFISKIGIPVYQVLSPNGGEQWQTGSTKTVYWNFIYAGNYVNIQLSLDNGANWIMLNSSPVEAALGRYSFKVPNVNSSHCLMKVVRSENSNCFDISDKPFTISSSVPYSLSLIVPNYSKLQVGKNYSINWTESGINMVNLAYTCDAGVTWNSIATALPTNPGTYEWTIPNISASNCYLKISDSTQPTIYDWSDQAFNICKLQLLSPNGGELYPINTNIYISWSSVLIEYLKIEYSLDNGNSWETISNNISAAAGSYNWTSPNIPNINYNQCLIKISDAYDNTILDISDNPFTIRTQIFVIAPNGNEYFTVNSICNLLWTNTTDVSFILIDYSIDEGKKWLPVQASPYPASIGRYDWLVPNNPSTNCLIKVYNSSNRANFDVSDKIFTITPGY
ncbi:MAG: SBBP repeat-containing protein [Candidatus Cloacimonas sp.]